jgi:hypothetical protein
MYTQKKTKAGKIINGIECHKNGQNESNEDLKDPLRRNEILVTKKGRIDSRCRMGKSRTGRPRPLVLARGGQSS